MSNNPFASFDIYLPNSCKKQVEKFCQTAGRKEGVLISPFPRQVDFWFTSFLYAASKGIERTKEKDTYKMMQGVILSQEPHRIWTIQLVALSISADPKILIRPREMFDIASELAFAGAPFVANILDDPDEDKPLWALLNLYEDLSNSD